MLTERGIELTLLVGQGTPAEESKRDNGELPWAKSIETRYFANGRICWQALRNHLTDSQLVIVTQENKLIQNHLLMCAPRRFKLAFWGHGANLQSKNPRGIKERFKRWTTNQVDWWFAYTEKSAELVREAGFPSGKITVLDNAVDTSELSRQRQLLTPDETQSLRFSLGFGEGPIGVFVGSLYAEKRLDFLLAAAEAIHCRITDFQLLIVGDGPEREKIREWCRSHSWTHWAGARFGQEKAACLSIAKVMLSPGAVGLGILDAFACATPILTTRSSGHGPEISYLDNDINGIITNNDLNSYVEACVRLLKNPEALCFLRAGCKSSQSKYTIQNMAKKFSDGIEMAITKDTV